MHLKKYRQNTKTLLRGNAGLLVTINFLLGFVFWYGIEKVFLRDVIDIGAQGVGIIAITYMIIAVLLDVPSGIMADRWGRKKMLVTGIILFMIADVALGSATSFAGYLLATVLWALYFVAVSGTYESFTYESLAEEKRSSDYQKVDAFQRVAFMVGIFISSGLSGFLANWLGMEWPFYLSVVPLIIALFCAVRLKEPLVHKPHSQVGFFQHGKKAMSIIFQSTATRTVAAIIVIITVLQNFLYEYSQYYYLALFNDDIVITAIINGSTALLLGIGYIIARRVKSYGMMLSIMGGLLAVASSWSSQWAILVFCAAYPLLAIVQNLTQTDLQHGLSSSIRTASTSSVNFIANCFVVPLTLTFAYSIDTYGAQVAYVYAGGALLVLGLPFVYVRSQGGVKLAGQHEDPLATEFVTK